MIGSYQGHDTVEVNELDLSKTPQENTVKRKRRLMVTGPTGQRFYMFDDKCKFFINGRDAGVGEAGAAQLQGGDQLEVDGQPAVTIKAWRQMAPPVQGMNVVPRSGFNPGGAQQ